jgi:hypothetical protein
MAEKVLQTGIVREPEWMYYIKDDGVWRVRRKAPGQEAATPPERVKEARFEMKQAEYIYFLDKDGDIARAARQAAPKPTATDEE